MMRCGPGGGVLRRPPARDLSSAVPSAVERYSTWCHLAVDVDGERATRFSDCAQASQTALQRPAGSCSSSGLDAGQAGQAGSSEAVLTQPGLQEEVEAWVASQWLRSGGVLPPFPRAREPPQARSSAGPGKQRTSVPPRSGPRRGPFKASAWMVRDVRGRPGRRAPAPPAAVGRVTQGQASSQPFHAVQQRLGDRARLSMLSRHRTWPQQSPPAHPHGQHHPPPQRHRIRTHLRRRTRSANTLPRCSVPRAAKRAPHALDQT